MLKEKEISKFKNYWLSDPNFRGRIYNCFKVYNLSSEKIYYTKFDKFYPEYDFLFSQDEAWSFLVGMVFPRRTKLLFEVSEFRPGYYSLGLKFSGNGLWLHFWLQNKKNSPNSDRFSFPEFDSLKDNNYLSVPFSDLEHNKINIYYFLNI